MKEKNNSTNIFTKENYIWMLAGLVVIALGFLLMAGGKSADPKVFNDNDVNSFRRITLAPFLIIAGFVLEIIGIMKKPKLAQD
jgi:uncharacterized membrane protein